MTTRKRLEIAQAMMRFLIRKISHADPKEWLVLQDGDTVLVSWESGPCEWAPALTGGAVIEAGELGCWSEANPWYDEFAAWCRSRGVHVECQNDFQLSVWEA